VNPNKVLGPKRGILPALCGRESPQCQPKSFNQNLTYPAGGGKVEITEVRITLRDEEKLKAFANVTFDNAFVVRGLKVINGTSGYFVSMPSRKRPDGTHQDIAHPVNNEMRRIIEDKVLEAYESELKSKGSA
jgi:stage V sporulation protein G